MPWLQHVHGSHKRQVLWWCGVLFKANGYCKAEHGRQWGYPYACHQAWRMQSYNMRGKSPASNEWGAPYYVGGDQGQVYIKKDKFKIRLWSDNHNSYKVRWACYSIRILQSPRLMENFRMTKISDIFHKFAIVLQKCAYKLTIFLPLEKCIDFNDTLLYNAVVWEK